MPGPEEYDGMDWFKPLKAACSRLETIDGVPTFSCSPDSDPADVAMEASAHARRFSIPVNFVCDGKTRQIGPKDVFFRHRPKVIG